MKMNLQVERLYENDEQSCNDVIDVRMVYVMSCDKCVYYKLGLVHIFLSRI